MENKRRKAVAYLRYSSDNQSKNSIDYQRMIVNTYCIQNSIDLVDEYIDEAFSATKDKRPNFLRMLEDAQNGPSWSMILVFDLSRYARNFFDAAKYTQTLEDLGIEVVSVTQEFGNSNEDFLAKWMIHLLNDFYSKNNSKHTHAGLKSKAQQGFHCGGKPPLGFDVDKDKRLIVNKQEAKIIKLIFDMYELNYSYTKMAEVLNSRGYCNKNGNAFNKNSFDNILRQEKYKGTFVWNKAKAKNSKHQRNSHKSKPLEEQVIIEGGCPAIISKEQFDRVQEKMNDRSDKIKSSSHYMLSSLKILKCGECGSYMTGIKRTSHGRTYTTYYCPKHRNQSCSMKEIPTKDLDNFIAEILSQELCYRKDLDEISAYLNNSEEYIRVKHKIQGNKKASSNVIKAIGNYYMPELVEELKNLSKQKKELEGIISEYEDSSKVIDENNIQEIAEKFKACLIESDMPEIKSYLKEHISEIIVDKDDVTIEFNAA